MINNNYSPNFTSTFIPYKAKLPVTAIPEKLSPFFELRGFGGKTVNEIRNSIKLNEAGVNIGKNGLTIVGKDREADAFIARQLKDIPTAKYTQDTPVTKFDGEAFDIIA